MESVVQLTLEIRIRLAKVGGFLPQLCNLSGLQPILRIRGPLFEVLAVETPTDLLTASMICWNMVAKPGSTPVVGGT